MYRGFSLRVLNNYLMWQTVRSLTVALSKAFRDAYRGLRKALIGSEGGEEPWRFCVTDTNNVVGFATGAMFVREVYKAEIRPGVSRAGQSPRHYVCGERELP